MPSAVMLNKQFTKSCNVGMLEFIYSTIRLRARDFYKAIVDEGEARINYHLIEIENE